MTCKTYNGYEVWVDDKDYWKLCNAGFALIIRNCRSEELKKQPGIFSAGPSVEKLRYFEELLSLWKSADQNKIINRITELEKCKDLTTSWSGITPFGTMLSQLRNLLNSQTRMNAIHSLVSSFRSS